MDRHYRILGWIFITTGAMWLAVSLIVGPTLLKAMDSLSSGHSTAAQDEVGQVMQAMSFAFSLYGMIAILFGVLSVAAGYGLLRRMNWARTLTILISIIWCGWFPIGTAVGVYGLWAMFRTNAPLAWDGYVRRTTDSEIR